MIQVPRFRRNLRPAFLDRDRTILSAGGQEILVEGSHCGSVAMRIDGRRSAEEIITFLSAEADPLEVLHALVELETKGLLVEAAEMEDSPFSECRDGLRLDPSQMPADFSVVGDLSRHLDPIAGIVRSIMIRDASHDFLPVVFAPQRLPERSESPANPFALAVGTGVTEADARLSCLGEAVERYSAAFDGSEDILRCRREDLDAPHFGAGELLGIDCGEPQEAESDWTPVWSFTRNEKVWIPAACCFLAYPDDSLHADRIAADSNGCAAGKTLADAIVRGFCEMVERDALALWWYNRVQRPEISLDSGGCSLAARFHWSLASIGRTFHLLDLTTDLELPAVAAISARADGSGVVFGFGAHFLLESAIQHSVLELQQVLGAADGLPEPGSSTSFGQWLSSIDLNQEPWLRPGVAGSREDSQQDASLEGCLEIVRMHRMEFLVANLTRPGIDVPVVRVMVPGLRSAQPRFGPGRLYDVPLALGWLDRRLSESELNPFPFFL